MENSEAQLNFGLIPESVDVGKLEKRDLLAALLKSNIELNQAAKDLFNDDRFIPSKRIKRVRIVALTASDLGFPSGATYPKIVERALELGLVECPLELGPYLRLQFLSQTESALGQTSAKGKAPCGALTVASKPLDDSDKTPKGFYLRSIDGSGWLRGYWSGEGHVWEGEDILVFSQSEAKV